MQPLNLQTNDGPTMENRGVVHARLTPDSCMGIGVDLIGRTFATGRLFSRDVEMENWLLKETNRVCYALRDSEHSEISRVIQACQHQ